MPINDPMIDLPSAEFPNAFANPGVNDPSLFNVRTAPKSRARRGTPSCGLLQVIKPTFEAHKLPQSAYDRAGVKADANDMTDPVANLVTASHYAAGRYGSIDKVNGPY